MSRMRKNDKRMRLIQATYALIEEKTVHRTTLADIAKHADIPLGNVYYYFKTKDEIVMAAIKHRQTMLRTMFDDWTYLPSPLARLEAFIQQTAENAAHLARYGSLIGTLCQELSKFQQTPGLEAAALLRAQITWVTQQLQSCGQSPAVAAAMAEHMVCRLEGISLLCATFKDPALCIQEAQHLRLWVKSKLTESVPA